MPAPPPTTAAAPAGAVEVALRLRRRDLLSVVGLGVALCGVSVCWQLAEGAGWQPTSLQLDRILDVDNDLSVLNWLSASVFLLAGLLASRLAARAPAGARTWWWVLSTGVVLVSLDEAVGASDPVRVLAQQAAARGGGDLVPVVLAGTAALAVGVAVLRVLPPGVRVRAGLAVVLVLLAAVGLDELGPDLAGRPEDRLQGWYVAKSTLEEGLELVAAVVLLDAMMIAAGTFGAGTSGAGTFGAGTFGVGTFGVGTFGAGRSVGGMAVPGLETVETPPVGAVAVVPVVPVGVVPGDVAPVGMGPGLAVPGLSVPGLAPGLVQPRPVVPSGGEQPQRQAP